MASPRGLAPGRRVLAARDGPEDDPLLVPPVSPRQERRAREWRVSRQQGLRAFLDLSSFPPGSTPE